MCPVKINLHEQLLTWRRDLALGGQLSRSKRFAMKWASRVYQRPRLYGFLGGIARTDLRWMPRFLVYNRMNPWGKQRELPAQPKQSFREMYAERKRGE